MTSEQLPTHTSAVITAADDRAANARRYRHEGCAQILYMGGTKPDTTWVNPLDDCPFPDYAECPECIQWLPVERAS